MCLPSVLTIPFKELAGRHESRDAGIVELLELCGHWRMIPTSYQLEGVVKRWGYEYAQYTSKKAEVWHSKYREKEVALKILKVDRDDPQAQAVESVSMSLDSKTSLFFGINRRHSNSARRQL